MPKPPTKTSMSADDRGVYGFELSTRSVIDLNIRDMPLKVMENEGESTIRWVTAIFSTTDLSDVLGTTVCSLLPQARMMEFRLSLHESGLLSPGAADFMLNMQRRALARLAQEAIEYPTDWTRFTKYKRDLNKDKEMEGKMRDWYGCMMRKWNEEDGPPIDGGD